MVDRNTFVRLTVGLIVSLAAHLWVAVSVVGTVAGGDADDGGDSADAVEMVDKEHDEAKELSPGELKESDDEFEVNLVTFEYYREVEAREYKADQPMVQMDVDPTYGVDEVPLDPTDALEGGIDDREENYTLESVDILEEEKAGESKGELNGESGLLAVVIDNGDGGMISLNIEGGVDVEEDKSEEIVEKGEMDLSMRKSGSVVMIVEEDGEEEEGIGSESMVRIGPVIRSGIESLTDDPGLRPTAALKSDSEAVGASRRGSVAMVPGGVVSVKGVKIRTVRPRFSVVALMTSVPLSPQFVVTFGSDGKVIKVRKVRSSGYSVVDGPVVTSLYKMTAEGDYGGEFVLELTVDLWGRNEKKVEGDDEEKKEEDGGKNKEGEVEGSEDLGK